MRDGLSVLRRSQAHGNVLPTALRGGTRTLFSFQGTTDLFAQRGWKAEMTMANTEKRLTTGSNTVACGGLKPHYVKGEAPAYFVTRRDHEAGCAASKSIFEC
jgi:hypothetical protein